MSSNLSHEWSGCFSGLLPGSRRQRSCQSVPLQGESVAPLAPQESSHGKTLRGEFVGVIYTDIQMVCGLTLIQPEYVRIASSCDFGSAPREGGLPPPYSWTTSEKDHTPDGMKTIEDTIHGLDHELRQLSLDIHGERRRNPEKH